MFAQACELARQFTRPVVISKRDKSGRCSAAIGAFVVINTDGWAVTAWHIIEALEKIAKAAQSHQDAEAKRAAINADPNLDKKRRREELRPFPPFPALRRRTHRFGGPRITPWRKTSLRWRRLISYFLG